MAGWIRLVLVTGLVVSAGLLAAVGGGWGTAIGVAQVAIAAFLLLRRTLTAVQGATAFLLVLAPFAAIRHWTARLSGACKCARLPHPPPGLLSWTGVAVGLDLALLGLTLWLRATQRATTRKAEVGQSSPLTRPPSDRERSR